MFEDSVLTWRSFESGSIQLFVMFAFCDYQADENFVQLRYDRLVCEVVRNLELQEHSNEPFQASTVVACNPLSRSTNLSL